MVVVMVDKVELIQGQMMVVEVVEALVQQVLQVVPPTLIFQMVEQEKILHLLLTQHRLIL